MSQKNSFQKWLVSMVLIFMLVFTGIVASGCSQSATNESEGKSTETGKSTGSEASGEEEDPYEQRKAQRDSLKDIKDMSELYVLNCGPCHGHDGSGVIGPAIKGTSLSVEQVQMKIEGGGKEMPAFKDQELSDEQIKALAKFVKEELK